MFRTIDHIKREQRLSSPLLWH